MLISWLLSWSGDRRNPGHAQNRDNTHHVAVTLMWLSGEGR
jgi:hypothetical protein